MPYCFAGPQQAAANNGIKLFYRTYGHGPTKVLLIIGLAGTHESWRPQIEGLTGTVTPNNDETDTVGWSSPEERCGCCSQSSCRGIEVCAFDNRGMGRSSVPADKSEYT